MMLCCKPDNNRRIKQKETRLKTIQIFIIEHKEKQGVVVNCSHIIFIVFMYDLEEE